MSFFIRIHAPVQTKLISYSDSAPFGASFNNTHQMFIVPIDDQRGTWNAHVFCLMKHVKINLSARIDDEIMM